LNRIIFIIFAAAFHLIGCEKQDSSNKFPKLTFRHDSNLLSNLVKHEYFSFFPPKGFFLIDEEKHEKIKFEIENSINSYFKVKVLGIYENLNGVVIIISKVQGENSIFNLLSDVFESDLALAFGLPKVNRGQFLTNNIETVQFIRSNENIINYKIFFDVLNQTGFQIDFFVPKERFTKFQNKMESSISTFNLN
tara:strand:+ start:55 stop:633 length:579 start_codon:yes stop_codon:yes gene_type:complete